MNSENLTLKDDKVTLANQISTMNSTITTLNNENLTLKDDKVTLVNQISTLNSNITSQNNENETQNKITSEQN